MKNAAVQTHASPRPAPLSKWLGTALFPRGVRIAHFIIVPAIGMGAILGLFWLIDRLVLPSLVPGGLEFYQALRGVVIVVAMSSLIAFLAIRYRSDYETKLRARAEDLEATRDFLSQIIVGSAEAIITCDLDGRVTSWNPAAEEIYGWPAAEMIGAPLDRLILDTPAERSGYERMRAAIARGETIRHLSATRVHKTGKTISVALSMSPIYDRSGRLTGNIAIVRDVTSLREMEDRLMEREMLAAVGEMAAILAHEVRNPLAGIRGGCEILLEGYRPDDPRAEIGREVIHQVDRLNGTVQDLLLFARPKAMDPVPTDLHALLDHLLAVVHEDPANRHVELRRAYSPESLVARVDARQMEQVFLNLILNAIQAMVHRGTVTVSTCVNVETVEVQILDTGPGIPTEKLDQIFKPFFTTRAHGTGLGLAICRKIVETHGGRIEADAPAGGGARFTVTIPRAE